MKKTLYLTLVLLTLSLALVVTAFATIHAQRDEVTMTREDLYGDFAAAEGLEVQLSSTFHQHLYWDTTLAQLPDSTASTDYTFHPMHFSRMGAYIPGGLMLDVAISYGIDMAAVEAGYGLAPAYQALYDQTLPGEESSAVISLKDYFDYYPVSFNLSLPGLQIDSYHNSSLFFKTEEEPPAEQELLIALNDFLRIPVLEEDVVEISISRFMSDNVYSFGSSGAAVPNYDTYGFMTCSAYTDSACYFTIESRSRKGELVDLSLIPGGYGIYCLPYTQQTEDAAASVQVDQLSTVYPLDPNIEILGLFVSEEQSRLELYTKESGIIVLTVIDIATMQQLQRLEIAYWPDGIYGWDHYYGDHFRTLTLFNQYYAVIAIDESGFYTLEFITECAPSGTDLADFRNYRVKMDYDGERLAVIDHTLEESRRWETCGFYLAVYTIDGMQYFGAFHSSLNVPTEPINYNFFCYPTDGSDLDVHWKETGGNS